MDATGSSLITTFDYVWARLTSRLGGLTDEEYFWEPAAVLARSASRSRRRGPAS